MRVARVVRGGITNNNKARSVPGLRRTHLKPKTNIEIVSVLHFSSYEHCLHRNGEGGALACKEEE